MRGLDQVIAQWFASRNELQQEWLLYRGRLDLKCKYYKMKLIWAIRGTMYIWIPFSCISHAAIQLHMTTETSNLPEFLAWYHLLSFRQSSAEESAILPPSPARKSNHSVNSQWGKLLNLFLLSLDMPCLCKQCRSRSVGFWRGTVCQ